MRIHQIQIPIPKIWQEFEDQCFLLFQAHWGDPNAQKNGRNGQTQHGTDIYGQPKSAGGAFHGIQCKGKDSRYGGEVTEEKLRAEIAKAEEFDPPLANWTLVTTAKKDAAIQEVARKISVERAAAGKFTVAVAGWEDIEFVFAQNPHIAQLLHPQLFGSPTQHDTSTRISAWETVRFEGSRDLLPALAGRSLGPADAAACPRLPEAETILRQLGDSYSARLVGSPGDGKSVCAYQALATLHVSGWSIYRARDARSIVGLPSDCPSKSVFLIDDAHLTVPGDIDAIHHEATADQYVLSVHTVAADGAAPRGGIPINARQAVKTIAASLRRDIRTTAQLVKKVDKRIGVGLGSESIEWRLNDAEKAERPWQFCFVLGGGWRLANEIANAARAMGAGPVLALLAARQIASRDAKCSIDDIRPMLAKLPGAMAQHERAINWLANERHILADDDLRTPHQRFAAVIVGRLVEKSLADKDPTIVEIMRRVIVDPSMPIGGVATLIYELPYSRSEGIFQLGELLGFEVVGVLQQRCWAAVTHSERQYAGVIIERLVWHEVLTSAELIAPHYNTLVRWIIECNSESAYGVSNALNILGYHTEDEVGRALKKQLLADVPPDVMAKKFTDAEVRGFYTISEVMSRLPYDEEGSWRKRFISSIDFENIYARFPHWKLDDGFYLARFSMMLSSFDVEACINFAERALPILKAILARDPAKGFHETDDLWNFAIRAHDILGLHVGDRAQTSRQKKLAMRVCEDFDAADLAKKLSAIPHLHFQSATYFVHFLHENNPAMFNQVAELMDWTSIERAVEWDASGITHEAMILFNQFSQNDTSKAKILEILMRHATEIKLVPARLAMAYPEFAFSVVERGEPIDMKEELASLHYGAGTYLIYYFGEHRPDLLDKLLEPHHDSLANAFCHHQANVYEKKHKLLDVLQHYRPDLLKSVLSRINVHSAAMGWAACLESGNPEQEVVAAAIIEATISYSGPVGDLARQMREKYGDKTIRPKD